jgi:hypothetical protein
VYFMAAALKQTGARRSTAASKKRKKADPRTPTFTTVGAWIGTFVPAQCQVFSM